MWRLSQTKKRTTAAIKKSKKSVIRNRAYRGPCLYSTGYKSIMSNIGNTEMAKAAIPRKYGRQNSGLS